MLDPVGAVVPQSDPLLESDTPSPTMEASDTQGMSHSPPDVEPTKEIVPSTDSTISSAPPPPQASPVSVEAKEERAYMEARLAEYVKTLPEVADKIDALGYGLEELTKKLRKTKLTNEKLMMRVVPIACRLGKRVLDAETQTEDEAFKLFHANQEDQVVAFCFCALDAVRALDAVESVLWVLLAGYEANSVFGEHTLDKIVAELLAP